MEGAGKIEPVVVGIIVTAALSAVVNGIQVFGGNRWGGGLSITIGVILLSAILVSYRDKIKSSPGRRFIPWVLILSFSAFWAWRLFGHHFEKVTPNNPQSEAAAAVPNPEKKQLVPRKPELKPSADTLVAPNALIATQGQQGDNTVNVSPVQKISRPQLGPITLSRKNVLEKDGFKTDLEFSVVSEVQVSQMRVEVHAPGMTKVIAYPWPPRFVSSSEGVKGDVGYSVLQDVFGTYRMTVVTKAAVENFPIQIVLTRGSEHFSFQGSF